MNFESFLKEGITEKMLDSELKEIRRVESLFLDPKIVKFVKDVDKTADTEVFMAYEAAKEAIADFIYELDSAGANL
jgi:hypothetical protein